MYAVVTENTLGATELAFSFMQETGNDTKVFHKDIYSSDEYVADYTGFTFALSQLSPVGASRGGVFKPYLLQVQGPALFLQYLQEIELDDGPRLIEQSPIDGKYYVKMKNSPAVVLQFWQKRVNAGQEPNDEAILGAMKDYGSYNYGFARGFLAGGWSMVEGAWDLLQWGVDASTSYSPRMITWRLSNHDTFETEKRFVRSSAETAKQLAEIYAAVRQDEIVYLTALLNGTEPDPNDLSPYNIAMMDAAEVIIEMGKDLASEYANEPLKLGYFEGRATFEILSIILPYTKAGTVGKLSKLQFLNELRARPMFSSASGKGFAAVERLVEFLAEIGTTRFCFVAGTPVHTDAGLKNIEEIVAGDRVLSRDEATGEQSWKPVLHTVVTHPSELYDVHYVPQGQAKAAEDKLTVTGEHPFFVSNRPHQGFVPVRELHVGDKLLTADGGSAFVTEITIQESSPDDTFTTYNFEVEDFHTYFVGESGLWVHNLGKAPCDRVFSLFVRYARELGLSGNALKVERFNVLVRTKRASRGIDAVWGRSSADVMQKMLDDYAAGGVFSSVDQLPSFNAWKQFFRGSKTQGGMDIHHSVEGYIQGLLGIPEHVSGARLWDLCPGIPLPRNKAILDQLNAPFDEVRKLKPIHKGMDNGGISGILQSRIPTPSRGNNMTRQQIVNELKDIYQTTPGFDNT